MQLCFGKIGSAERKIDMFKIVKKFKICVGFHSILKRVRFYQNRSSVGPDYVHSGKESIFLCLVFINNSLRQKLLSESW